MVFRLMAAQKWMVYCTFMVVFIFTTKAKLFSACKKEISEEMKKAMAALKKCKCKGKSVT